MDVLSRAIRESPGNQSLYMSVRGESYRVNGGCKGVDADRLKTLLSDRLDLTVLSGSVI